ncbi:MAG TPA: DUF1801 domain-containing protein [Thermoanaerobaculia bacterium]|nr:DUF1801 domain-containing protein [Thermoanaerobaculia bacterium]
MPTVSEYLRELPEDRRKVIAKLRTVIRRHLPKGYEEAVSLGTIVWRIPLQRFPDTYNGQPLWYAALAARKNYYTLHLMTAYANANEQRWLRDAFRKAGKKLDMGKACIRFKRLDDLPLDVIGEVIGRTTPEEFVAFYKASRES